jgi:hypothetical protein
MPVKAGAQRHRSSGPRGRAHVYWLGALTALLLLTATGTTFALLRQGSGQGSSTSPGAGGGQTPAQLSAAAAVRAQAAGWVAREISRSDIIGCDPMMCAALSKAHVPSSDVQQIASTAQDPLGVNVIVATSVLRSEFGSRLATEYAPVVLGSFGHGSQQVQVRYVAPLGAAAYQAKAVQDLAERKRAGAELLGASNISMPDAAKGVLAAGDVDPRLLTMLPVLASQHPIRILSFYNKAPHASPGVPMTAVRLAGTDPQAGLAAQAYQTWLLSFFHGQNSTFRPASVSTTTVDGQIVIDVRFAWPSPLGLLNQ